MHSLFEKQRLKELADHLEISQRLLKQASDRWMIEGKDGTIHSDGLTWLIFVHCRSKRAWSAAKRKLSFLQLMDDLGEGGRFELDRIPNQDEAPIIRRALGLKKKPTLNADYRKQLANRLIRKTDQTVKKASAAPSIAPFQDHKATGFEKPGTETHSFLKPNNSWRQGTNGTNAEKPEASPEIEVLNRCKFVGKLHPWKPKVGREILGLLVPVETALDEVRYATNQPDLTRADLVRILGQNKVSIFSTPDQFAKAKEASRNAEIVQQTKRNAAAKHSRFAESASI